MPSYEELVVLVAEQAVQLAEQAVLIEALRVELARVSNDLEASAVFPQAQLFSIFSLAYYPRQRCGAYWARSKVV